ncbi:MAG: iron-containing redox enzyme family protein [Nitrospiraceae bacterium]
MKARQTTTRAARTKSRSRTTSPTRTASRAKALSAAEFQERILAIMDQKHHWAWPVLMGPGITKDQLQLHYQQEYKVYVRDFPVLLARVHGQNPPPDVRRMLAGNIYEEDTGGLSFGRSHPDLFHEMMAGLGFSRESFERTKLMPAAAAYRAWLDKATASREWVIGAATMAIFVEGSIKDRKEILGGAEAKPTTDIEAYVSAHPLIQHHGIARSAMDLIRAHQTVEAGHRHDAYNMVVTHATTATQRQAVLDALRRSLRLWIAYRDAIVKACGLRRP